MTEPEKAKKNIIRDKVFATGESLGFDDYNIAVSARNPPEFGLCSTCMRMQYAKTEHRVRRAWCSEFDFRLSSSDPITDCTNNEKIGSMTLQNMWNMATLIDVPGRRIGFEGEEKDANIDRYSNEGEL